MIAKTIPLARALEIAMDMHRTGQLHQAEKMYVEILRQDPGNIDAIHLLGVLANQGGNPEVAEQLIGRALARRPEDPVIQFNYAEALSALNRQAEAVAYYQKAAVQHADHYESHNNMSQSLVAMGRFVEAAEAARKAIALDPEAWVAYNNLGNALRGQNRIAEAADAYQASASRSPRAAEPLSNLGIVQGMMGCTDEGIHTLRDAVRQNPTLRDAHNNLGTLLAGAGKIDDAIKSFETAIKLSPDFGDAHNNLSAAFRSIGELKAALEHAERAVELLPESLNAFYNRAVTLRDLGRFDDAMKDIDSLLEREPKSVHAHYSRGMLYREQNKPDNAIASFRTALELVPNRADIMATLGYALQERGELDEAMALLKASIAQRADPGTHSNVMMVMCYHPNVTPAEHFEAHRRFAQVHEDPIKSLWKPHNNTRDPNRRLKIGYFSPDMRSHVVSYFTTPIFANHNHEQFEIFAYANHFQTDSTTIMHRAKFDHWRSTAGMTHDAIAEMIRRDEIDILIELAGHTANNGLPVLARKPAPIQMNAIGFPSTTGLTSVDYRITDERCDPPGIAEAHNSEKLLYMPDCFWVYEPPMEDIDVAPLPADSSGYVTFISVNNFTKVTPQVLKRWAQILQRVPASRIILQTSALASDFLKNRVREIFAAEGVSEDRIDMRTMAPFADYLRTLTHADIMLDPFPFNGGTTTCHGLWMGLPIITLAGEMHAGRMGLSMLHTLGLDELCASDENEYVELAATLAQDLPRLREIRTTMRERLQNSSLLDAPRYVKNLEASYRRVWTEWCNVPASLTQK